MQKLKKNMKLNFTKYLAPLGWGLVFATCAYYYRPQKLENVKVEARFVNERLGGFDEWDLAYNVQNIVYEFEGIEGCFEDRSIQKLYPVYSPKFWESTFDDGEEIKEVTFRNYLPVPKFISEYNCYIIKNTKPHKEKLFHTGSIIEDILIDL